MKTLTLNQYASRLEGCAGFVLLELIEQPENGIGNLQDVLAKSERTIERAVLELEKLGLCTREERFVYLAHNWRQICGIFDSASPKTAQDVRTFAAEVPQERGENAAETPQKCRKNAAKMTYSVFDGEFGQWGDYRGEGFSFCFLISSKDQKESTVITVDGGSGGKPQILQTPPTLPKPKRTPKPKSLAAAKWLELQTKWQTELEAGKRDVLIPPWLDLEAWAMWLKDLDERKIGVTEGMLVNHLQKLEKIEHEGESRGIENPQKVAVSEACGRWKAPYLPREFQNPSSSPPKTVTRDAKPKRSLNDPSRYDEDDEHD